MFRNRSLAFLLAAALFAGACDQGPDTAVAPSTIGTLTLDDIIASAQVGTVQGIRRDGPVTPGNGPQLSVSGNQTVINGGTLTVTVTSATPFETIYVYVGADALGIDVAAEVGVGGYYEITLPSPQLSASVLLTFPQSITLDEFDLLFSGVGPGGDVGPFAELSTNVTQVGTGDVQVTLSWDSDSDVDLHVVEPGGEETYYADRQSATGGQLDLDSNAACSIDGVRNENITWPVGRAPRGVYTVRVDYWDNCDVGVTNYTVRVNNGGSVQVFTGSFTGPGDQGGAGSGVTITTFERLTGPTSQSIPGGAQVTTVLPKKVSGHAR